MTRQEYLQDSENRHREYWAQYVNSQTRKLVKERIGLKTLQASTDEHFNDTGLIRWDCLASTTRSYVLGYKLRDNGETWSLSANICILKEAAQQLLEGANNG
jgi:hypothetical protein